MDDPERGILQLWPDPRDGLPPDEAPWDWDEESRTKNGPTEKPPHNRGRWWRWYSIYHKPTCQNVKISADEDPQTGNWFNPHPSSGET